MSTAPETLPRTTVTQADGRRLFVYGRAPGALPPRAATRPSGGQHQRRDAISDTWVAVSPSRNTRPQTATDGAACPLCPGGPEVPFGYDAAVFENRWPTFAAAPPPVPADAEGDVVPATGRSEVVLYTESHVGWFGSLAPAQVARVMAVWQDRSRALWADPRHAAVLVFENRGEAVGATLSHPHGQIFAFDRVPPLLRQRVDAAAASRARHGTCLHCAVVAGDAGSAERTVSAREHVVVAVPFAPRWPYEVVVRVRRHGARRLGDLEPDELIDLAAALQDVVLRYAALFGAEVPYMMAAMEAPAVETGEPVADWHLSFEFAPPQRSATKLKVRASVETFTGQFINDTCPEASARALAAATPPSRPWAGIRVPTVVEG